MRGLEGQLIQALAEEPTPDLEGLAMRAREKGLTQDLACPSVCK